MKQILECRSMRSSRDNLAQLGKEIMEGIKSVTHMISIIFTNLIFYDTRVFAERTKSFDRSFGCLIDWWWSRKNFFRQKTKALATGFGSFVEKNLPPFSRWNHQLIFGFASDSICQSWIQQSAKSKSLTCWQAPTKTRLVKKRFKNSLIINTQAASPLIFSGGFLSYL